MKLSIKSSEQQFINGDKYWFVDKVCYESGIEFKIGDPVIFLAEDYETNDLIEDYIASMILLENGEIQVSLKYTAVGRIDISQIEKDNYGEIA